MKYKLSLIGLIFSAIGSHLAIADPYVAEPGRYQPQNSYEAEQERALDEWENEQKAVIRGDSASHSGYKAAPGRYQPTNGDEAAQERALDEWMKQQQSDIQ